MPGFAQCEEHLSVGCQLSDRAVAHVDAEYRVVGADSDSMGCDKDILAPRTKELPVTVEDDDRVSAAIVDVDVVAAVHGDCRGLLIDPAIGQFTPILAGDLICVFATAELCHGLSLPSWVIF